MSVQRFSPGRAKVCFFALVVFSGCGGDLGQPPVSNPTQVEPGLAQVEPTDSVANVVSAFDESPPVDNGDLGSRFAAKPLILPDQPTVGRAVRFSVDEGRRGAWVLKLGGQALLTPSFSDGRIYAGAGFSSHQLYGIDARTGEVAWAAAAPDGGPTAAIIERNRVLYNTESCTLFAVDAETGTELWKRWLGDPLMGQPAAYAGRVFSGHIRDRGRSGYGFTALGLEHGNELWSIDVSADVMNAPVLDERNVYFTTMDGILHSVDQRTGRVNWRKRMQASSAPWLDGDRLVVARRGTETLSSGATVGTEQTVVLAKASGEEIAAHEVVAAPSVPERPDTSVMAGWAHEGSRPTIVDGRMYQTIGNEVQCRDATTGRLLWRRRYTNEATVRAASPPAIAGAQLVIGTESGELIGLDIDSGLTMWAYQLGEPVVAQPTIAEGWVYAATTQGSIFGIEIADSALDGWHMWGGNSMHNGEVAVRRAVPVAARPTEGVLRLGDSDQGQPFPLQGTAVTAEVTGHVARVRVEQTFRNPHSEAVEAVYLFPLPENSAVDAMVLRTGDREIRGQILPRLDARRQYERARDSGLLVTILEQERENLFQQRVANLEPGEAVTIKIEYVEALPYEDGSYRLVFPTVAAPRSGETHDDATPGEHRVVSAPGSARSDRVTFELLADLGDVRVDSPSHSLQVDRLRNRTRVRLDPAGVAPDRDIEVRFHVAGDEPEVRVAAAPPTESTSGYLSLVVHPELETEGSEVTPRELVFLIDTSSSMLGAPLMQAQRAVARTLDGLQRGDTFRIVQFSDQTGTFANDATPATAENIERAKAYVNALRALGTSAMEDGIRAALAPASDPSRLRIVLLLSDGYIGNEADVFRAVSANLGSARVFAFGVGSAVNRYLFSRLTEIGRGSMQVVNLSESPELAADRFHERIARPYLTDVEVDWGDLAVSDVYPRRIPDLYADQPLVVQGRFAAGGTANVTVRGKIGGEAWQKTIRVTLPQVQREASSRDLASLWARTRVRDLMTAMALQPNEAFQTEVTNLGLQYGILTEWTAFIAIEGEGEGVPNVAQNRPAPPPVIVPGQHGYDFADEMVEGSLSQPSPMAAEPMYMRRSASPARILPDLPADGPPPEVPLVDVHDIPICEPQPCTCPDGSESMTVCQPDGSMGGCGC